MLTYEQAAEFLLYLLMTVSIMFFAIGYICYRIGHSDGREEGLKIRRHIERKVRRGEIKQLN